MATNTSSNMVVDLTAESAIVPVRKGISFRNSIPFVTSLLQGSAVGDIHFYDERIPVICERTWTEGNVLQVFYGERMLCLTGLRLPYNQTIFLNAFL